MLVVPRMVFPHRETGRDVGLKRVLGPEDLQDVGEKWHMAHGMIQLNFEVNL
jgi:hypothetical protein